MKKIIVLAILILLILGGYMVYTNYKYARIEADNAIKNIPESISVSDQKLFNQDPIIKDRIFIDVVSLSRPGYIAVYENLNDKFGTLIGTSMFLTSGEHKNVPVDLAKEEKAGTKLYVILHNDDGDQVFNLVQDPSAQSTSRQDIMASFVIKAE